MSSDFSPVATGHFTSSSHLPSPTPPDTLDTLDTPDTPVPIPFSISADQYPVALIGLRDPDTIKADWIDNWESAT